MSLKVYLKVGVGAYEEVLAVIEEDDIVHVALRPDSEVAAGELQKVRIGHDGRGLGAGWFLEQVGLCGARYDSLRDGTESVDGKSLSELLELGR